MYHLSPPPPTLTSFPHLLFLSAKYNLCKFSVYMMLCSSSINLSSKTEIHAFTAFPPPVCILSQVLGLVPNFLPPSPLPFIPEEYSSRPNNMPEDLPWFPVFLRWPCPPSPSGILIFSYLWHSVGYSGLSKTRPYVGGKFPGDMRGKTSTPGPGSFEEFPSILSLLATEFTQPVDSREEVFFGLSVNVCGVSCCLCWVGVKGRTIKGGRNGKAPSVHQAPLEALGIQFWKAQYLL